MDIVCEFQIIQVRHQLISTESATQRLKKIADLVSDYPTIMLIAS